MAGTTTRFGFAGAGGTSVDEADDRPAHTHYGHDLHQPAARPSDPVPDAPPEDDESAAPTERIPSRLPTGRGRAPSHSGKSRFPALARLFGRITTGGRFDASESWDTNTESLVIPRNNSLRAVLVVLAAGAVGFFAIAALLKTRGAPAPVAPAPIAAPAVAPAQPAIAPPDPRPQVAPRVADSESLVHSWASDRPRVPRPRTAAEPGDRAPKRALTRPALRRRPPAPPADPDGPMPLRF